MVIRYGVGGAGSGVKIESALKVPTFWHHEVKTSSPDSAVVHGPMTGGLWPLQGPLFPSLRTLSQIENKM